MLEKGASLIITTRTTIAAITVALLCSPLPATAQDAAEQPGTDSASAADRDETIRYVRDWISIPLHASATADSKVVHPGVISGTALTLLKSDDNSGFARVRTGDGVEGWIASRYLIGEPTAKLQLEKASADLADLRSQNEQLRSEHANLPADQRAAGQQLAQLKDDNARLQSELETFQQAPDNAAQLAQENIELKKSETALQQQLDQSNTELAKLRLGQNFALFREGAIAVLAGALLAVLIPRLWPKKRSEWA